VELDEFGGKEKVKEEEAKPEKVGQLEEIGEGKR